MSCSTARCARHGPTEALFTNPQHPYTQRLLGSEPKGAANPLQGSAETVLEGRDVRVTYHPAQGRRLPRHLSELQAVDGLSLDLKRGETLGLVGESPGRARPPSARR